MAHDGEVVRGMVGAGTHTVIAEDDIHAPVKAVLNAQVLANRAVQACCIRGQAADVETKFKRGLALDRPFRGNHGKQSQIRSALRAR